MRTEFSAAQLADPAMAASEAVIRKCVHCGFCTATCPTYLLLGDELDSPRGRIYLMKDMLEGERAPTAEIVKHVDRCLSCLSCMTTCPSGVNYMHLVDHARTYIEQRYRRPLGDRLIRLLLAWTLPFPRRFRLALALARFAKPFAHWLPARLGGMIELAPAHLSPAVAARQSIAGRRRVLLLQGCAEPVLKPQYRAAAIRLLNRCGMTVSFAAGEGCCGALTHHMGRESDGLEAARRNIDAWIADIEHGEIDAILVTASGCGTAIKDYGFLLRDDPAYAAKAERISALARDICEFLVTLDLPPGDGRGLVVAYQAACSLQHGQKVTEAPRRLLAQMGYTVRTPIEAHICCGSAGTYNILQPQIAGQLGRRKADNLARLGADLIATGNVGCATQIARFTTTPIVHIVELLDWATGGPAPEALVTFNRRH
ncbi:glycolate oxidase subunit GlcF [Sphingomonas sp. BIUV-7]|uniref:Glycolate oxidase iron-sulfur subunit n=1 Tax=Sphingomonas natans TaxID=3063330 RepID=A0ABT8Y8Q3_9SPHN|nr:glycolate oxidase subunit GlcF [Sphingomonas sp. BIUV-7]MDO6414713.1 glycolate oxidase subunit GlcF [Sphingomonas sp. BIUV-7]